MGFAIAPDGKLSTLWATTSVLEYILLGIWKREKEKTRAKRKAEKAELEALRAQANGI